MCIDRCVNLPPPLEPAHTGRRSSSFTTIYILSSWTDFPLSFMSFSATSRIEDIPHPCQTVPPMIKHNSQNKNGRISLLMKKVVLALVKAHTALSLENTTLVVDAELKENQSLRPPAD